MKNETNYVTHNKNKIPKIWSWQPKGGRKKGKEKIKLKENKTRTNNKASSIKPDDVCAYSLRFYAKRISRLVPLLAYWFHCRRFFFFQSHLSSSSILSRRLVHSDGKIMHSFSQWLCIIFKATILILVVGLLLLPFPSYLIQYGFHVSRNHSASYWDSFIPPDSWKGHQLWSLLSYSSW